MHTTNAATAMSSSDGTKMQFRAHGQPVSCCRFLNHGKLIATASHDKTIGISESCSGSKLHSLCGGHEHRVVSLSTSMSGGSLISASWDKNLIQWDLDSLDQTWTGKHESLLTSCHTTPDHPLVVAGCDDGSYHYWDTRAAQRVASVNAHTSTITCCRLSANGIDLCTCSMDKSARIWDLRTHRQLITLRDHVNVTSGCAISHNGHYLATCSWDKTVRVYDINSGSYRSNGPTVLSTHVGCVSACCFSQDGTLLVSCGYDQDISIWTTSNMNLRNAFRGHDGWIEDVDIDENSKHIVSCGQDGKVYVWGTDVAKSKHLARKEKFEGMDVVTCSKCGRTFLPAGSEEITATMSERLTSNEEDKNLYNGGVKEENERWCVFCRLKDPSRTLEQRSGQYLSDYKANQS